MDNSLYKVFETEDAQGISWSGLELENQIRIPLEAQEKIEGTFEWFCRRKTADSNSVSLANLIWVLPNFWRKQRFLVSLQ